MDFEAESSLRTSVCIASTEITVGSASAAQLMRITRAGVLQALGGDGPAMAAFELQVLGEARPLPRSRGGFPILDLRVHEEESALHYGSGVRTLEQSDEKG